MGGLISVYVGMAEPNLFKSMIVVGPLIKPDPNVATPIKKMATKVFGRILPYIFIGELDESGITRDEAVVKRIMEDPLNWHGGININLNFSEDVYFFSGV